MIIGIISYVIKNIGFLASQGFTETILVSTLNNIEHHLQHQT